MAEPPDVVGDPALSEQSAAQLAAGRLPTQAEHRLAEMRSRGSYTSDLSTGEFASIRSVGFDPVGQVFGSCVYQVGYTGTWSCGGAVGYGYGYQGGGYPGRGYGPGGPGSGGLLGASLGRVGGLPGGFAGPLSMGAPVGGNDPGYPILEPEKLPGSSVATPLVRSLREARRLATERMTAECAALGGDGVVAVRLTFAPFPGTSAVEFSAIGTAVRARASARPRRPFLSDLSGQQFALLLRAGWVPCGLALGISVVVRHDSFRTRSVASATNWSNTEVPGYTALVQETRKDARHALAEDVHAVGGEGVVVGDMTLHVGEQECRLIEGGRDHLAEVVVVGTALARFNRTSGVREVPTLPILRLSDRRRTAAAP